MRRRRLSGLVLMSIEKPVDCDAVIQRFADQKPQRMFLVDLICIKFCIYICIPRVDTN